MSRFSPLIVKYFPFGALILTLIPNYLLRNSSYGKIPRIYRFRKKVNERCIQLPYRSCHLRRTAQIRHDLHGDGYYFGGRYARPRYRNPFCTIENKAKGTAYAIQMAYLRGYRFSFHFFDFVFAFSFIFLTLY